MKRHLLIAAVLALILTLIAPAALAHGHGGGHGGGYGGGYSSGGHHGGGSSYTPSAPTYGYCADRYCTAAYTHSHNGTYYKPHSYNDGHSYHRGPRGW